MSSPIKTVSVSVIDNKIDELNLLRNVINKVLSIETNNIYEVIFNKYVELQSASHTAEYLNNAGYRIKTDECERKYISNDITSILKGQHKKEYGNALLFKFAKAVFLFYKGKNTWGALMRACDEIFNNLI